MSFVFEPMNEDYACAIASWHYQGSYAFYNAENDLEDLAELLDASNWKDRYWAVLDDQCELVGFFVFARDGDAVEIGLGLRPVLTGMGLGLPFVLAGLDFARQRYSPVYLRLGVATFNQRAMRVYERAGFSRGETFIQKTNGGEYEFVRMERLA